MSEFVISLPELELDTKQSARFQKAIQEAAEKELGPIVASPEEILKDFPIGYQPPPGGHGPGRGPSSPTSPGGPGPAQPTYPVYGVGKPIGKSPLPIVIPVSYRPQTQSWSRK